MTLSLATQADVAGIADELTRRHPTAVGVDGFRLRRIWTAFENQSLVVAVDPATDSLVGYGANVPQPAGHGDPRVLLMTGEVFEDFRSRGWGRRLIQWCVDHARTDTKQSTVVGARNSEVLLVCEHGDESGGLNRVLSRLDFNLREFNEVTCDVESLTSPESLPVSISIARMESDIVSWIEERQRDGDHSGLSGHGEWSIAQAWRDKHREPDACLVARRGTDVLGYVVSMRYPKWPQELWVEVLHAAPTLLRDRGYEALLKLAAHAIGLRSGTVSMSWQSEKPPERWRLTGRWWRCVLTVAAT